MAELNNEIEKYLKGELTPSEMHALEQKALYDPFLAEALEGAEEAGARDFAADIEMLQRSIREKSRKRLPKTITLNGWGLYAGIAAGLALLAVSTYIIFLSLRQQGDSGLISQAKKETPAETIPAPADTIKDELPVAAETDTLIALNKPIESGVTRKRTTSRKPLKRESQPSNEPIGEVATGTATVQEQDHSDESKPAEGEALPTGPVVTQAPVESGSGNDVSSTEDTRKFEDNSSETVLARDKDKEKGYADIEEKADRDVLAKRRSQANAGSVQQRTADLSKSLEEKIIRGKVVSKDDGTAIPGVNVVIKGTNQGTVTDLGGNYEIKIHSEQSLMFDFIGYSQEEVEVKTDTTELNVQLETDVAALSEVVVTGFGATGTDMVMVSPPTPIFFEMAEPAGGRKAFKKYLEEQKRYPKQALENKVEGKVTVQFTVDIDGTLSDFKILKGLGYGCDEELIRLIKEGPKWAPSKQNDEPVKENVKVRLKFELPR